MVQLSKPLMRGAGALSVVIGAVVTPIAAQAQSAPAVKSAEAPSAAAGQIVARDVDTGLLRAATAEEAQALQRHRAALRKPAEATLPRSHPSGAVGARLTDEFMSYSVVVKQPDGKLVEVCVQGPDAAAKAMSSSVTAKSAGLPTE